LDYAWISFTKAMPRYFLLSVSDQCVIKFTPHILAQKEKTDIKTTYSYNK